MPTPAEVETPLMPVIWTPTFRTLVMFLLVSANSMLAPESTRTRRCWLAPPNVVTVGESGLEVEIEGLEVEVEGLEVEVEAVEDKTQTVALSGDSHNLFSGVRPPVSLTK